MALFKWFFGKSSGPESAESVIAREIRVLAPMCETIRVGHLQPSAQKGISSHWCACVFFYGSTLVAVRRKDFGIDQDLLRGFGKHVQMKMVAEEISLQSAIGLLNPLADREELEALANAEVEGIHRVVEYCEDNKWDRAYEPIAVQLTDTFSVAGDVEARKEIEKLFESYVSRAWVTVIPALKRGFA